MNNLRVTRILETAFSKEDAAELAEELTITKNTLATKTDLQVALKDLEIKMLKIIGAQTLILLAGVGAMLQIHR
jgi:hypothetical protein